MTAKGVRAYRRANPGSKLKTAVTGKVKRGSKAAKRSESFCARSRSGLDQEVKQLDEDGDVNHLKPKSFMRRKRRS